MADAGSGTTGTTCAQDHFDLHEHAGLQFAFGIGQRRLHLNVPRGLVDHRVERRDLAR